MNNNENHNSRQANCIKREKEAMEKFFLEILMHKVQERKVLHLLQVKINCCFLLEFPFQYYSVTFSAVVPPNSAGLPSLPNCGGREDNGAQIVGGIDAEV